MAFLGMRGTGAWGTDVRPKSYRETILYLYPNGDAPLTAMLSKMRSSRVDDPEFNWWTQTYPAKYATVTGVYTDAVLATAYTSSGADGDVLYVKCSQADTTYFRPGHQVIFRVDADISADVNGKVLAVVPAGASSYIVVKLLEADDNSTASKDISDTNRLCIIGNMNPEGGVIPEAISYDETKWNNYTQIFRTPLEISRTEMRTTFRTGPRYRKLKREALEDHSREMELAFMFGVPTEKVGQNGKPERTTGGLIWAIKNGGTVSNYVVDETYNGLTWIQGGETWLNAKLEVMFRYGSTRRLVFCGSGALLGIQQLVNAGADYNIEGGTKFYGLNIREWRTPFGDVSFITHPLLSYDPSLRNAMIVFEPENLEYRYIDDTTFFAEGEKQNTGHGRIDGIKEEFLTEAGLEYHHPVGWGLLTGVGLANP